MNYPPMILPNDPKKALETIASYLRTVRDEPSRRVYQDGELVGIWQTKEWLDGLLEIADECNRLSKP